MKTISVSGDEAQDVLPQIRQLGNSEYFKLKALEKMTSHCELSPTLLSCNRSGKHHMTRTFSCLEERHVLISQDKGLPRKNLSKQALLSFPTHSPP